jgi:hypothetical protein
MTMRTTRSNRAHLLGFLTMGLLLVASVATAAAQDDFEDTNAEIPGAHPAHIHVGTCAELDPNPAFPLNSVSLPVGENNEVVTNNDLQGALTNQPVETSESEAAVKFEDLLTTSYAINIHESAQNIQNYIACGDIGGFVVEGKLSMSLLPQNNSGRTGIAILEEDGDNTKVTILLGGGEMPEPATTPATDQTPAPETTEIVVTEAPQETEVTVTQTPTATPVA